MGIGKVGPCHNWESEIRTDVWETGTIQLRGYFGCTVPGFRCGFFMRNKLESSLYRWDTQKHVVRGMGVWKRTLVPMEYERWKVKRFSGKGKIC